MEKVSLFMMALVQGMVGFIFVYELIKTSARGWRYTIGEIVPGSIIAMYFMASSVLLAVMGWNN